MGIKLYQRSKMALIKEKRTYDTILAWAEGQGAAT